METKLFSSNKIIFGSASKFLDTLI